MCQAYNCLFSDIAGNKLVYETLPDLREVAHDLYGQLLFTQDDLTEIPRHLQFLYKLMRQEMIAGSETLVLPEVDALIDHFRNFDGRGGDLIEYSTQVAKSRTEAMPAREKFELWTKVIHPEWLKLYQMDADDPNFQQQQQSQSGQNQTNTSDQQHEPDKPNQSEQNESSDQEQQDQIGQAEPDEQQESASPDDSDGKNQSQAGESDSQEQQGGQPSQTSNDTRSSKPDFSQYHDEYSNKLHPDHLSHEQIDQLTEQVKKQQAQEARDKRQKDREDADRANPTKQLDAQIRRETGHGLAEKRRYDSEVVRWSEQIQQLRDVFASILNERIAHKRRLRGNHPEGALLNPETLAQTYIDVQTNHPEPPAYADYESHEAERSITGKTDYVFVFDRSGSMEGEKSRAAASSLVIMLEALAAMQRDIREAEAQHNIEVDLDIRTALYTFNHEIHTPKKLSSGLSDKERLDAYSLVTQANGNNADSHVLRDVEEIGRDKTRKQILIVVSDGQADDKSAARSSIDRLRQNGWQVYGVSIGSPDAVQLYAPDSQRIDDPSLLPGKLQSLIERTIA